MRWNVVIGGQLVSKSYRGYTSFLPGVFEKEGLIVAASIFIIPCLVLWRFDKIFPFFKRGGSPGLPAHGTVAKIGPNRGNGAR